jgi:hypothetical protein
MYRGAPEHSIDGFAESEPLTFASTAGSVESRNGIRTVRDQASINCRADRLLSAVGTAEAGRCSGRNPAAIEARCETGTATVVSMQLEYPRRTP